MPEMDRRTMMLAAGFGGLAAAVPTPAVCAIKSRPVPPPAAPSSQGAYIFQDEFVGPAGSAPDG
ncbi:MAG: 1,3-beta-glucanase, partial [Mycobacterium sp.]